MLQSAPVGGKVWNPVKSGLTNLRQLEKSKEKLEQDEGYRLQQEIRLKNRYVPRN